MAVFTARSTFQVRMSSWNGDVPESIAPARHWDDMDPTVLRVRATTGQGGRDTGWVDVYHGRFTYNHAQHTVTGPLTSYEGRWKGATAITLTKIDHTFTADRGFEWAEVLDGKDVMTGSRLGDTLYAYAGNDIMRGGGGKDSLYGGAGADQIDGGADADYMAGGTGNDTYWVNSRTDAVSEMAAFGDSGADRVLATVSYTLGNTAEVETLAAAKAGSTTDLRLTGNDFANAITGNAGDNELQGMGGRDTLQGGAGDDILDGGRGQDSLKGGSGADRFDFDAVEDSQSASGLDVVTFVQSDGDKIDLNGIDANAAASGDQNFAWVDAGRLDAAFTGVAGQIRFAEGTLSADTNGDKIADFAVAIRGTFGAGDVIL